jgi:hypothetical protein
VVANGGKGPIVTTIGMGSGPNAAVARTRQEGRIADLRCARKLNWAT